MEALFTAELRNIKIVQNILKSITFRENANFKITAESIKITIDEMQCVQISAYIPSDVFNSYNFKADTSILFKINMKMFTDCLNIFGDDVNPGLKIIYQNHHEPLILIMYQDEDDITLDCNLFTMEAEDILDLNLSDEVRTNKVILKAQSFVNLIHDLDITSSELELILSPTSPYFRLVTNGLMSKTEIDISPESEMIELFQCKEKTHQRYTLILIKQLERIISLSSRISINTSKEIGLLSVQLIIENNDNTISVTTLNNSYRMWVEYFCTSLLDEDD